MPPKQLKPFNHDELVNFKIVKSKSQDNILEQVTYIQLNIQVAEQNAIAVLQAAHRIAPIFAKFDRVTTFDLQSISNLVQDLRTIFRLLRTRLSRQFPQSPVRGPLAGPGDQIPDRIRQNVYTCLCPLTVLLQAVAQCLSDLKVHAPSNAGPDAWGTIQPLHRFLVNMERSLTSTRDIDPSLPRDFIGLAFCIMLHEKNSRYLVTSTAPSFGGLKGLDAYGRRLRIMHMSRMRQALSEEARGRVEGLQTYSENVKMERDAAFTAKQPWSGVPSAKLETPEPLLGHNAAFRTTGQFMTACLLDHLRFQIGKSEHAADLERSKGPEERGVSGTTSCAEWELYITLLYNPDPRQPHAPQFVAVTYGMPKSKTWEKSKVNSRPAMTAHQAPKPTPLPAMPRPT